MIVYPIQLKMCDSVCNLFVSSMHEERFSIKEAQKPKSLPFVKGCNLQSPEYQHRPLGPRLVNLVLGFSEKGNSARFSLNKGFIQAIFGAASIFGMNMIKRCICNCSRPADTINWEGLDGKRTNSCFLMMCFWRILHGLNQSGLATP